MNERTCWRCGKGFSLGGLNYIIQVKVYAGFDGVLIEPKEGVERSLRYLLDQAGRSDPKELEKEVYEEFTFLLCKSCRDRFVNEMEHPWEGPFFTQRDPDQTLH